MISVLYMYQNIDCDLFKTQLLYLEEHILRDSYCTRQKQHGKQWSAAARYNVGNSSHMGVKRQLTQLILHDYLYLNTAMSVIVAKWEVSQPARKGKTITASIRMSTRFS